MFTKKIFSLLGLIFIGNRIGSVRSANDDCNVNDPTKCISNTYYLVNKETHSVITSGYGNLYYCFTDNALTTCQEQTNVGYYFVDKKTVYVCRIDNGNLKCSLESININECNANNIGKLFMKTDDTIASLCLNYEAEKAFTVELNGSTKGNYLVYKNSNPGENIFGITGSNEKYAIVGVNDKVVSLNATYTNGLKYVYVDATKSRVMEKGDKDFPKADGSTTDPNEDSIMELLCSSGKCKNYDAEVKINAFAGFDQTPGIYLLKVNGGTTTQLTNSNIDSEITGALDKVGLYNCDKEMNCERLAGYAWNDDKSKIYRIPASGSVDDISSTADTTHEDAFCTGKLGLIYTLEDDKNICIEDGVGVKIEANKYYIFGDTAMDSSSPFLSVTNKILKMTADYAVIDDTFKAENNKNYILNVGDKYYSYVFDESTTSFRKDDKLSTGVKNYDLHTTNFNIYDEYPLKDTSAITSATSITNWALFNCRHGECIRTFGFMKSQNEDKYFKYYDLTIAGKPNEILEEANLSTDCVNGKTYDIIKEGTLCIVGSDTATARRYGKMDDGGLYVVPTANDNNSVFKKEASKFVLVEATKYSITYNNIYEGRNGILTYNNNQISSSDIDNNNKTNLELYDCDSDGVCVRAGGYAINDNKYYTLKAAAVSAEYPEIVEVADCTGKEGNIVKIGKSNYLCLDATSKVNLEDYGYYALGDVTFATTANGNPFADADNKKMIRITSDLIAFDHKFDDYSKCIIKNDQKYQAYEQSSKKYTLNLEENGIKIYESVMETNILTVVTSPQTATPETDIKAWALFDCTNGACDRTYGYYKSGSNVLALSYQDNANQLITPAVMANNTCTQSSDIGQIVTDSKLCVINNNTSGNEKTYAMANEVRYALNDTNSNIFAPSSEGSLLIIKGTENSFTLLTAPTKFNVVSVNKATGEVGDPSYSDNNAKGMVSILKCSEKSICDRVSGYTKDTSDNYYSVSVSTGAQNENPEEGTCSSSNTGSIILKGGVKILCLGSGSSIQIPEGKGRFVLGTTSSTTLTTGKLININPNYIVVDDVVEGDTDANYLINFNGGVYVAYKYTKTKGTYSIDTNVSGMKLYQIIDNEAGTNVLQEFTSDIYVNDLSRLVLFQCNGGRCSEMPGYLFVSGKIYKCSDGHCSTEAPSEEKVNANACTSATAVGKVIAAQTKIQLCMYGATPAVVDISDADAYYLGPDTTHIKKYIGNSKNTIIALPKPEIGYFLINNNKISTTGNIIKCDGGENCVKMETNANCGSDVGKFNSERKLCLATGKASVAIGTEGSYIMSYNVNSAFKSILKTSGSTVILIAMDTKSITVDTSKTSICVNNETLAASNKSGSCVEGAKEYTCNNTGLCIEGANALTESTEKKLKTCPEGCSSKDSAGTAVAFCIAADKKIYTLGDDNKCMYAEVLDEGPHLFKITNSDSDVKELTLNTGKIISHEAENLALYQCNDSNECQQIEGYVKLATYTEVQSEPSNWGSTYNSYIATINYNGADVAATATWTPPIYSVNANSYYYVTKNGALSTGSSFSNSCTTSDAGKIASDGSVCISSSKPLAFGTNARKELVTNGSAQWYIEFNTDYIVKTKIAGTLVSGANVFDTAKLELVNYTATTNADLTTAKDTLVLYNCDVSVGKLCLKTIGYIKSKDGKFEISDSSPGTNNKASTGITCDNSTGKIGTLSAEASKLCVVKGTSNENDAKLAEFSNGYYYINAPDAESVFTGKTGALVRASESFIILDNLYGNNGAKIPIVINTETKKVQTLGVDLDSLKAKLEIYECKTGTCTRTAGYAHGDGNHYYAMLSDNVSSEFTLLTTCEGNVGKLITGGKLCISSEDGEAIPLTTKVDYIINDSAFKYVRVIENIASIGSIANSIADGVNFVNVETATVITLGTNANLLSDLSNDLSNLALYYCNTGSKICKRTYGYFKTTGTEYYSVSPSETSVLSLASSCSSSNIGLMFNEHKLCLTGDSNDSLTFNGNNYNYQLKSALPIATGNAFSPENNLDLVIEITASTIAINPLHYLTLANGVHVISIGATDKKISEVNLSTSTIANDDISNVRIYGCFNGKCVRTYGYIKDQTNKLAIKNGAENAKVESAVNNCNTVGLLFTDFKLCVNSDTANVVDFISNGSISNYIINAPNGNIFTNTASDGILIRATDHVFVLNNFEVKEGNRYIVKEGDDFHHYNYSNGLMTRVTTALDVGTYDLINGSDTTFYRVSGLTNIDSYSGISNIALFECDVNGNCTRHYGYYKVGSDYIKIGALEVTNAKVTATTCSAIGDLLTNGKLCSIGSGTSGLDIATGNNVIEYILTNIPNTNPFTGAVTSNNIIVKSTANYFILEKLEGINIKKISSNTVTSFSAGDCGNSNATNVFMLDCDTAHVCKKVSGFVKDTNYYTIAAAGGATSISGTANTATLDQVTGSGHCNGKIGKIGTNNTKNYLCLTADLSIDLSTSTGNYVIETPTADTVFYSNNNKMLIVAENYIALDTTVTGSASDKFIIKMGDTYRLYNYDGSAFTADTKKIGTFRVYEGHPNVFSEIKATTLQSYTSATDFDGIKLFKCVKGICSEKKGYVLGGNEGTAKIYSNSSGWSEFTQGTCATIANDAGKIKITNNKIQICKFNGATNADLVDIGSANYLIGKSRTTYKYYSADSDIILIEEDPVGYYMTTAAGVIETETTTKDGDLLVACVNNSGISCTSTVSNVVTSAGYYLNAALSDHLIYCAASNNCQLKTNTDIQNKSFFGVGGILISCNNDKICSNPTTSNNDEYIIFDDTTHKHYKSNGSTLSLVTTASIETYGKVGASDATLFKLTDLSNETIYPNKDSIATISMFDCNNEGSCYETYGYYKAGNRFVLVATTHNNNNFINGEEDCTTVDALLNDGTLCDGSKGLAMANNKEYVLTYDDSNCVFTGSTVTGEILVKATSKSFTLNKDNKSNTDYCVTTANVASPKEGDNCGDDSPYTCTNSGTCTAADV